MERMLLILLAVVASFSAGSGDPVHVSRYADLTSRIQKRSVVENVSNDSTSTSTNTTTTTSPPTDPWQVVIKLKDNKSRPLVAGQAFPLDCVGSIIDEFWVVTAAHCLYDLRASKFIGHLVGDDSSTFKIKYIIIHEDYNASLASNDIALIRTSTPIAFNEKVNKIHITPEGVRADFSSCATREWEYPEGKPAGKTAVAVEDVALVDLARCRKDVEEDLIDTRMHREAAANNMSLGNMSTDSWPGREEVESLFSAREIVDETHICAYDFLQDPSYDANGEQIGMIKIKSRPCQVLEGGEPLVCKKDNIPYLVGVAGGIHVQDMETKDDVCDGRYTTRLVYASMASFSSWICKIIGRPFCNPTCPKVIATGKCLNLVKGFGFNSTSQNCEEFSEVACDVTGEMFEDWGTCMQTCTSACGMPKVLGNDECETEAAWTYFDTTLKKCETEVFKDYCGANDNRFKDRWECEVACHDVEKLDNDERQELCDKADMEQISAAECTMQQACGSLSCPAFEKAECKPHRCHTEKRCSARWWLEGDGFEHDVTYACNISQGFNPVKKTCEQTKKMCDRNYRDSSKSLEDLKTYKECFEKDEECITTRSAVHAWIELYAPIVKETVCNARVSYCGVAWYISKKNQSDWEAYKTCVMATHEHFSNGWLGMIQSDCTTKLPETIKWIENKLSRFEEEGSFSRCDVDVLACQVQHSLNMKMYKACIKNITTYCEDKSNLQEHFCGEQMMMCGMDLKMKMLEIRETKKPHKHQRKNLVWESAARCVRKTDATCMEREMILMWLKGYTDRYQGIFESTRCDDEAEACDIGSMGIMPDPNTTKHGMYMMNIAPMLMTLRGESAFGSAHILTATGEHEETKRCLANITPGCDAQRKVQQRLNDTAQCEDRVARCFGILYMTGQLSHKDADWVDTMDECMPKINMECKKKSEAIWWLNEQMNKRNGNDGFHRVVKEQGTEEKTDNASMQTAWAGLIDMMEGMMNDNPKTDNKDNGKSDNEDVWNSDNEDDRESDNKDNSKSDNKDYGKGDNDRKSDNTEETGLDKMINNTLKEDANDSPIEMMNENLEVCEQKRVNNNASLETCSKINECDASPCKNGATCEDLVGEFNCSCADGYMGTYCEIDKNSCLASYCMNGATCEDGVATFTCSCQTGYNGRLCQYDIDDCFLKPCSKNGECVDGVNSYTCACSAGYGGALCETDINECASSPCTNGATCEEGLDMFTCRCKKGYTGTRCETNIDDCSRSACKNGGTCLDGLGTYTCTCPAGYTGPQCERAPPTPKPPATAKPTPKPTLKPTSKPAPTPDEDPELPESPDTAPVKDSGAGDLACMTYLTTALCLLTVLLV